MKMKNAPLFILFFFVVSANFLFAQTKVSGIVVDKTNQPIPYANVVFKDSNIGIVTNEDGRFYIESEKTFTTLIISSVGFSERSSKPFFSGSWSDQLNNFCAVEFSPSR